MLEFLFILLCLVILILFAYLKHKKDNKPTLLDKLHSSNSLNEIILLNEKIKLGLYDFYGLANLNEFLNIYTQELFKGSGVTSPIGYFTSIYDFKNYLYDISKNSPILTMNEKSFIKDKIIVDKISLDLIFIMYLNEVHDNNMAIRYIILNYIDKGKIKISD